jgi:hypothetical protein
LYKRRRQERAGSPELPAITCVYSLKTPPAGTETIRDQGGKAQIEQGWASDLLKLLDATILNIQ